MLGKLCSLRNKSILVLVLHFVNVGALFTLSLKYTHKQHYYSFLVCFVFKVRVLMNFKSFLFQPNFY